MAFDVIDARGEHVGYVARDFFDPDLARRFVLVALSQERFQPAWLNLQGVKKLLCSQFNKGPWATQVDPVAELLKQAAADKVPGLKLDSEEILWRYLLVRRVSPLKDYIKATADLATAYIGLDRESLIFSGSSLVIPQDLAEWSFPQVMTEPPLVGRVQGLPEVILLHNQVSRFSWKSFFHPSRVISTRLPVQSGTAHFTLHLPIPVQARSGVEVQLALDEPSFYCDGVLYRCEESLPWNLNL